MIKKILLTLILLSLSACSVNNMETPSNKEGKQDSETPVNEEVEQHIETPPEGYIQVETKKTPLIIGTYSWSTEGKNIEADSPSPDEIVSGTEPIKIDPNEEIKIIFSTEKKHNEIKVYTWNNTERGNEIFLVNDNSSFMSNSEKGIYSYGIEVNWPEGKVSYAVKVEVE